MKDTQVANWTTNKLKLEVTALSGMIYGVGCYGVKDFALYGLILDELEKRGIEVYTHQTVSFSDL